MREQPRTYYDVLGVTPETPAVVIKAAFRALAKEYHPDSSAEAAADPERFIELQDAYAVLSDPAARSNYDLALRDSLGPEASPPVEAEQGDAAAVVPAVQDGPALQAVHARFMLYSEELAAGFREALRSGRSEEELLVFADHLEDQFLREYFGEDHDVRALAKLLLLRCRKDAVLELNALVSASAGFPETARRRRIAEFVGRHFADEGLLSPWIRDRFCNTRAEAAGRVVEPSHKPQRRAAKALPQRRPHRVRSVVKVVCLSCAVYFGLLFVSAAGN